MQSSIFIKSLIFFFGLASLITIQAGQAQQRSWYQMPIGNGHGFQVFDRQAGKINVFLEHPYLYLAPSENDIPNSREREGIIRRDLAYDIYFGLAIDGQMQWLNNLQAPTSLIEYDQQTNMIKIQYSPSPKLQLEIYYTSPFGYEGNAFLMMVKATAIQPITLDLYAKANLKMGNRRPDPSDEQELIKFEQRYLIETGPGGGQFIYAPLGGMDSVGCGRDEEMYWSLANQNILLNAQNQPDSVFCQNADQVVVPKKTFIMNTNETQWWGMGLLFLNDQPNHPQKDLFRDESTLSDVMTRWENFVQNRPLSQIYQDLHSEWENWRKHEYPMDLNADEMKIWRQSESVLRMGQVRERNQALRKNHGMYLAALPTGRWQTGWLRDGVYSTVAMSVTHHFEEAKEGLNFFLNAPRGVFPQLNGGRYRLSSCRYFGNGLEEADGNYAGPNLETDGWGLALWGAGTYLKESCDLDWLDEITENGDSVFEALIEIGENIEDTIDPSTGLAGADCSIWEVHWDFKQKFTYTSAAQARGLFELAEIAKAKDRMDLSARFEVLAQRMQSAIAQWLVHPVYQSLVSHQNVAQQNVNMDGSVVEALNWGLFDINDPIYIGTLNQFYRLKTDHGGYRRLEPQLSLVGENNATEYDLSEWGYLNLRIADAWRKIGNFEIADRLISQVTRDALLNDHLIPELYHPNTGVYAGEIPMVGYGAGIWSLSKINQYANQIQLRDRDESREIGPIRCGQPTDPPVDPPITDMSIDDQDVVNDDMLNPNPNPNPNPDQNPNPNPDQNDQILTQNPEDQTLGPHLQDQMVTTNPNESVSQSKSESGCEVQNQAYGLMPLWFLLILCYGIVNKQRVIGTATSLRTYK